MINISQPFGFEPNPQTGADESNGTIKLPNGLIMKWGDKVVVNNATITFATEGVGAFPNNCFQVFVCQGDSTGWAGGTQGYNISKTQFTFSWGGSRTGTMRWFAVGS